MRRPAILILAFCSLALGGCSLDSLVAGLVNDPPQAVIDASPQQGNAPLTVNANAGYSRDDQAISQYY